MTSGRDHDPCAQWEHLLDSGVIENRNPPPAPDVVAARAANDALFRARRARERTFWVPD